MLRRPFAAATLVAVANACGAACGESSHVYEGRLYREDRDCLAGRATLDVVAGDRPGDCAPVCLVQGTPDGGRAVYTATMCPPYPFGFDTSGADPSCSAALDALARGSSCLSDGGASNPVPRDAGGD